MVGKPPVTGITAEHVLQIVEPIGTTKNETAGRVRGRIEKVLASPYGRGLFLADIPTIVAPPSPRQTLGTKCPARQRKAGNGYQMRLPESLKIGARDRLYRSDGRN
jgi:hypothetical protein